MISPTPDEYQWPPVQPGQPVPPQSSAHIWRMVLASGATIVCAPVALMLGWLVLVSHSVAETDSSYPIALVGFELAFVVCVALPLVMLFWALPQYRRVVALVGLVIATVLAGVAGLMAWQAISWYS